jgi:dienelactone hydrolase
LGRHIIGYELQKVLALVDWLESKGGSSASTGVVGYGEGGLLALYAGAVDPRIDIVGVSGYFDSRQNIWQEPLDRNVFGLLTEFGDAEAASMVAPRRLVVEACAHPAVVIPPGTGGGPGRIETPALKTVTSELERAIALQGSLDAPQPKLIASGDGSGPFGTAAFLAAILQGLAPQATLATTESTVKHLRTGFDPQLRLRTQFDEINRHTQRLLAESPHARAEFMASADRASRDPAKYLASTKSFRDYFRDRVVGRFDVERLSLNPRTRQVFDSPKYTGYEVVIDVFPDVFAYGIYLLPKGIPLGERRPVVVCQHGLEGRPRDVVQGDHRAYHDFAAKLAERGFVVFAPQNLYIFGDRFRTLQRKANAIEKTLFAIMAPQHQAIVDWLRTQPQVDPARIGFYGLSYGGKSAMRIPPLVDGYCLSICSADFNDWVWKNASTRSHYSYVRTGEYEIFEWDLGNTFNYAEMAGLICPRPFMVERGHRDGVAPDDRVAAEYAKIRLLYADLKIPERTEIEFFDGPHTIHGKGTFEFLHRHLEWPLPKEE